MSIPARAEGYDRAEVRRSFITTTVRDEIPGHTTRAPPVGFELETNGFQFYAIANLDKTSLIMKMDGGSSHFFLGPFNNNDPHATGFFTSEQSRIRIRALRIDFEKMEAVGV